MSDPEELSPEMFERLLARERRARKEAERLLDQKSVELYDTNQRLRALADDLEQRVQRRTAELEAERNRAVETAEALGESERRFSDVASIVGEYLWEVDADYCFTSVTSHVAAVLGYSEADLIGRSILDGMPPEDASQMLVVFKDASYAGQVFTNMAHRVYTKLGDIVWQRSSGAPSFDASGELVGFRGASLDVSEQERSKEQMQKLVIALQHASEGIVVTDPEGQLVFANNAFATMYGYQRCEDLLGLNWQEFHNEAEAKRIECSIRGPLALGEGYSGEGVGRRLDGCEFPTHFSVNRLPSRELLWISRDESERLSTLMSLQTQNSLLSALLENIRLGVLFEDSTGTEGVLYNNTIVQMLGLESGVLKGMRVVAPVFEALRTRCNNDASRQAVDLLLELDEVHDNIELCIDEDRYLLVDRIPVCVGSTYRGALWAIRDVSQVKRQESEMQEARLRAEAGDRSKSTFLANMSHEIRTPLNGICGMARILMSAHLDDATFEQVRGIQTSADSLLHVLNDILDFSKVEAGQLDIEVVEFDLAHVLDSTFTIMQAKALEHQLRFDFIYPDADLPIVHGDPSRLNEVLLNLLGNAMKFTTTGGITLTCELSDRSADSIKLAVSVRDTGIGMSDADLNHVFEPFSQADSSISRRFGGTGLGLSICQNLVSLMGGAIEVESELGVGTCFSFELPFEVSSGAKVIDSLESEPTFSVFVMTGSDVFYDVVRSMLAYVGASVARVDHAHAVESHLQLIGTSVPVLILDRSFQPDYDYSEDSDLLCEVPDGLRRLLVVDSAPLEDLEGVRMISYPFSRYKLLELLYSATDVHLPRVLFQEFGAESGDDVDLSGLRVLLAEDNTINQKVARMTIERHGGAVDIAANGLEVLECAKHFEYDLILMDIRMPEMDGVEACLQIRSLGLELPIYALTADAMKGDRERFMQAGMNGYLSKPLVDADLMHVLSEHCPPQETPEEGRDDAQEVSEISRADQLFEEAEAAEVLDIEAFYLLLGGEITIAHDLLAQFVGYAHQYAEEGLAALQCEDLDAARSRFHKLAGSAATIFAHQVRAYFLSFERSLMEEVPDVATCRARSAKGMDALHRLTQAIETTLKEY